MRPWTLNASEHSPDNPLLSDLSLRNQVSRAQGSASGSAHVSGDSSVLAPDSGDVVDHSPSKRRRLSSKTPTRDASFTQPRSYADSWEHYVRGNIISQMSKKYIRAGVKVPYSTALLPNGALHTFSPAFIRAFLSWVAWFGATAPSESTSQWFAPWRMSPTSRLQLQPCSRLMRRANSARTMQEFQKIIDTN